MLEQVLDEHLQAMDELGEEEEETKGLSVAILWRVCAIVGGIYIFYLFESILTSLTTCTHREVVCVFVCFLLWSAFIRFV